MKAIILLLLVIMPLTLANQNISKSEAEQAINTSKNLIASLEEDNVSVQAMKDSLQEAERVYLLATYASTLRNQSSSTAEKARAEQAVGLTNWEDITYHNVLEHTTTIEERGEQYYLLLDELSATNIKLNHYEEQGLITEEARTSYEEAKEAFELERYEEASEALSATLEALEVAKEEATFTNVLQKNTSALFKQYLLLTLGILCLLAGGGVISYRMYSHKRLVKHHAKLLAEKEALNELLKQAQTNHYKHHSLSKAAFQIKKKTYHERLHAVDRELPKVEAKLKK